MKSKLLILLLFFLNQKVFSGELFESNLSVRALGMGNAYISVVDDAYSLFYNPARLAFVDGMNFRLMDLYATASDPTELTDLIDSQSSSDDLGAVLDPFFGKNVAGGLGGRAAFAMPRLGLALYGDTQVGIDLTNPVLPDLDLRAVVDYGGVVGVAIPVFPFVNLGIAIKKVFRQGGTLDIGAATVGELDLDAITEEINRKGSALGMDLGLTVSVPGPFDIAASFAWKNVGGLSFSHDSGPGKPPSEKDEMILGVAAGVDLALIGVTAALDYKHLNNNDVQLGQKVHLGVEINFLNMDFRAGLNQGYYTLGYGLGLGLIDIDLATYGVEVGEFPGQKEDRRYALQITIELGINPFFSLGGDSSSGSGKSSRRTRRRGIKQRR